MDRRGLEPRPPACEAGALPSCAIGPFGRRGRNRTLSTVDLETTRQPSPHAHCTAIRAPATRIELASPHRQWGCLNQMHTQACISSCPRAESNGRSAFRKRSTRVRERGRSLGERRGSNSHEPEPQSGALPLGDAHHDMSSTVKCGDFSPHPSLGRKMS